MHTPAMGTRVESVLRWTGPAAAFPSALASVVALALATGGCGTGRTSHWEAPTTPTPTAAAPPAAPGAAPADHLAVAEAAWGKRGDRASLEAAIAQWEAHLAQQPNDGATLARLSRAYYLLADGHLRGQGPKYEAYLGAFEKGIAAGER